MAMDVSRIFRRFARRPMDVAVSEVRLQKEFHDVYVPADWQDPVLLDISRAAHDKGWEVLVWSPMVETDSTRVLVWANVPRERLRAEFNERQCVSVGRVNAYLEQGADGRWRVGDRFVVY